MEKSEIISLWEKFAKEKGVSLNPDKKQVEAIATGVLKNEKERGYRFCPCRFNDGTNASMVANLCPCDFESQDVWKTQGRCWCGLFVKT